jgi:hypothetical protein
MHTFPRSVIPRSIVRIIIATAIPPISRISVTGVIPWIVRLTISAVTPKTITTAFSPILVLHRTVTLYMRSTMTNVACTSHLWHLRHLRYLS